MAPVDPPPSSCPNALNLISPVPNLPIFKAPTSPVFSRPATPWPLGPHPQSISTPSDSTSTLPVSHFVSDALYCRSQLRRSFSSPSVASSLFAALPSPHTSSLTLLPDSHLPFDLHAPLPPSSPSSASFCPDVVPSVSIRSASHPAPLVSTVSSPLSQPLSVASPADVSIGVPVVSHLNPCSVGPPTCSAGSPSGLGFQHGSPEEMACPSVPPVAFPGLLDQTGLLSVQRLAAAGGGSIPRVQMPECKLAGVQMPECIFA